MSERPIPPPPPLPPNPRGTNRMVTSAKGDDYPPILRLSLPNLLNIRTHLTRAEEQENLREFHRSSMVNRNPPAAGSHVGNVVRHLEAPAATSSSTYLQGSHAGVSDLRQQRLYLRYNLSPPLREAFPRRQSAVNASAGTSVSGAASPTPASNNSNNNQNNNSSWGNNSDFVEYLNDQHTTVWEYHTLEYADEGVDTLNAPHPTEIFIPNSHEGLLADEGVRLHQPLPFYACNVRSIEEVIMKRDDLTSSSTAYRHEILGDPLSVPFDVWIHRKLAPKSDLPPSSLMSRWIVFTLVCVFFLCFHLAVLVASIAVRYYRPCDYVPRDSIVSNSFLLVSIVLKYIRRWIKREGRCHHLEHAYQGHNMLETSVLLIAVLEIIIHGFLFLWALLSIARAASTLLLLSAQSDGPHNSSVPYPHYAIGDCYSFILFYLIFSVVVLIYILVRTIVFCLSQFCQALCLRLLYSKKETKPTPHYTTNYLHQFVPPIIDGVPH